MKEKLIFICEKCGFILDNKDEMSKHEELPTDAHSSFSPGAKVMVNCEDSVFDTKMYEERLCEYVGYQYIFNQEKMTHVVAFVFKDDKFPGMYRLAIDDLDPENPEKQSLLGFSDWCFNSSWYESQKEEGRILI